MDGVIRTRVGYAGGHTANPTYHNLADHTEALQLDYDPDRVSYQELLHVFWLEHRPLSPPWSRQYMSAIFCSNLAQLEQANEVKAIFEARWGAAVHTEIRVDPVFHRAEDYHQKYQLQHHSRIMDDLNGYYPNFQDLVDSPTASRLNAFLGGALSKARLNRELNQFGLSEQARSILEKTVGV